MLFPCLFCLSSLQSPSSGKGPGLPLGKLPSLLESQEVPVRLTLQPPWKSTSPTHTFHPSSHEGFRRCVCPESVQWESTTGLLWQLLGMQWCVCMLLPQSCPTLCDPTDCSPPGSSVPGVLQARILEWVAVSFPGDLPDPGVEPSSPALQADSIPSEPPGKPPVYLHARTGSQRNCVV